MKSIKSPTKKSSVHRKKMNTESPDLLEQGKGKQLDSNLMTKLKYGEPNNRNIAEVTEDDYTHRIHDQQVQNQQISLMKQDEQKQSKWKKALHCLKSIVSCFGTKRKLEITVKEQLFAKKIEELREFGIPIDPLLPKPCTGNKKTIVLDLDHTLIHPSLTKIQRYDFSFQLPFNGKIHKIYCKNRFGLDSFLFQMSQLYELVLYSSGTVGYVDAILSNIDKKGRIKHRLHRDKCIKMNKVYFLKSMKLLGRDENSVIFIDNNPASGVLQPFNFLQVKPFKGENHDRELIKLIPFLKDLATHQSVAPVTKKYEQFCNIEIDLKFNNLEPDFHQNLKKEEQIWNEEEKQNTYMDLHDIKKKVENKIHLVDKKKKYTHSRACSEAEVLASQQETTIEQSQVQSCQTQENFPGILKDQDTNS